MSVEVQFRLEEVAKRCGLDTDIILRFVAYSWVQPLDVSNDIFDEEDVARIQLISDLQEKLGVNEDAVPVILHLIDQLNRIHLGPKPK